MKNLFLSVVLFIFTLSVAGAYYDTSDFTQKKNGYKLMMKKKVAPKLKRMPVKTQERLIDIINKKITQIEKSTSMSEKAKIQKLSLFFALKEVLKDILLIRPVVNIPGETV